MPVRFIEGVRPEQLEQVRSRNHELRFNTLAQAVRDHELAARRGDGLDPADEQLYRKLRQLCGDAGTREHAIA